MPGAEIPATRGSIRNAAHADRRGCRFIRRELVDAHVAAPLLSRSMPLVAANKNWVSLVAGINGDYLVAREWQIANGRSFAGDEIASGAKVAIVGSVIIEELFDGRAGVGETFRIGNVPFTVIGVLDKKGVGAAGRSRDRCRVHRAVDCEKPSARRRAWHDPRSLDFISIKVSDATAMPEMERKIEALLRQRHRVREDAPSDFGRENPADVVIDVEPPCGSSAFC